MVRVKVCGIRSYEDINVCAAAGADALGFIFASGPRRLPIDEAARLTELVPPFLTCVGVFANNESAFVKEAVRRCRLDVLQFSGDEAPAFRGAFAKPTIFVVHVPSASAGSAPGNDLALPDRAALRAARAVAVMVDSRVGNALGGTGIRVKDNVAARLSRACELPFILAGGLTPANLALALATVRPWGVDVRSGVESEGRKNSGLVERFVRTAKCSDGPLAPLSEGAAKPARPIGRNA